MVSIQILTVFKPAQNFNTVLEILFLFCNFRLFDVQYDQFGDAYSVRSTLESLKYSMKKVSELGKSQELSPCALAEFEHENLNFGENLKYGLFRQLTIYVDKFVLVGDESTAVQFHPLELTEMTCAFYGTRITGNPVHPDLSHVIVSQNDLERLDQLKKIRYV